MAKMDEPEKIPINVQLVWVTPKGAQGNRHAGLGVQFSEANFAAAAKIEEHLGTGLVSDRPTHTMSELQYCNSIGLTIIAMDLVSPD